MYIIYVLYKYVIYYAAYLTSYMYRDMCMYIYIVII